MYLNVYYFRFAKIGWEGSFAYEACFGRVEFVAARSVLINVSLQNEVYMYGVYSCGK